MLKRDYKVVIVIPAGHFPDIEILLRNLDRQKRYFDECHVWMNCRYKDILPIYNFSKNYPFVKCINPRWPERSIDNLQKQYLDLSRIKNKRSSK